MRKIILGAILSLSIASYAQTSRTVTFTPDLDIVQATSELANGGTYVPTAEKFISVHPSSIHVFNSTNGSYESDLSLNGISPSGNGFHAATATDGGHIYAVEDGSQDIWRWESVTDTAPVKVSDNAEKYWYGYTATVGNEITIGFSSPTIDGPATLFSDSFPFSSGSFSFSESAPIKSKMALAFNKSVDVAWTVGDTNRSYPLLRWIKAGGIWTQDTNWVSPRGGQDETGADPTAYYQGGPLAYDEANDLLLAITLHGYNLKVHAYDGTTGEDLGWHALVNEPYNPPRGGGAWVQGTAGSGTFYAAARGITGTNAINLYKFTYTVGTASNVSEWPLF